jgi:hypothetical protein
MPPLPRPLARRAAAGPDRDPAAWRAIADFVYAKGGEMRPSYAMLCVAYWLEREGGGAGICAADLKAIMPQLGDAVAGRLRSPADTLRRARDEQLLEPVGAGRYRLTPLGAAVVDALPDSAQVGAIRGSRGARCHRRPPGSFGDAGHDAA